MRRVIWGVFVCAVAAGPAFADFTTIQNATHAPEALLWEVMDVIAPLGSSASWGGASGNSDYLNAGAGTRRVHDRNASITDQYWRGGDVEVTGTALFWGGKAEEGSTVSQIFRYDNDLDGSSPTAPGVTASGESASFNLGAPSLSILGVDGNKEAWTRESLNEILLGGLDRAVTFDVSGLDVYAWTAGSKSSPTRSPIRGADAPGCAYIVAFDTGRDGDFQDMTVLIEGACPVPTPAAFVLGALGLGVAGLKLRKQA